MIIFKISLKLEKSIRNNGQFHFKQHSLFIFLTKKKKLITFSQNLNLKYVNWTIQITCKWPENRTWLIYDHPINFPKKESSSSSWLKMIQLQTTSEFWIAFILFEYDDAHGTTKDDELPVVPQKKSALPKGRFCLLIAKYFQWHHLRSRMKHFTQDSTELMN